MGRVETGTVTPAVAGVTSDAFKHFLVQHMLQLSPFSISYNNKTSV